MFVKANNVTEELLRSIFNANVANAKVLSIDIKTNFAFVSVDTTESANNAILELNGKLINWYNRDQNRPLFFLTYVKTKRNRTKYNQSYAIKAAITETILICFHDSLQQTELSFCFKNEFFLFR